jgi:hypothetical protein
VLSTLQKAVVSDALQVQLKTIEPATVPVFPKGNLNLTVSSCAEGAVSCHAFISAECDPSHLV